MLINTRTYSPDRITPDAVAYVGANHTLTANDKFEMKRTYPRPTGSFKGVGKPVAKMTKTVVINSTTGETAPLIVQFSGSVPVGTPSADVDAALADFAAWVDTADAKALFKSLDINA